MLLKCTSVWYLVWLLEVLAHVVELEQVSVRSAEGTTFGIGAYPHFAKRRGDLLVRVQLTDLEVVVDADTM